MGHIVTVGTKGQIVIPADLRRAVDLQPGQKVEVVLDTDTITLKPLPRDLIEALTGMLKDVPSLTEALLREHAEEIKRDEARSR